MFFWSKLAKLHPCENDRPNRVSNVKQYFDELNFEGFHFTNGFKCSGVQKFEKLNNLTVNIFELNFYQDQNKWKPNIVPFEISKNDESDRVVDLLIYKNHYVLTKKVNEFLGDHHKNVYCRRCLNSYTSENALLNHNENLGDDNICTITTSSESHFQWISHFLKNPFYFSVYADFVADNDIDNSTMGNKTTNFFLAKSGTERLSNRI